MLLLECAPSTHRVGHLGGRGARLVGLTRKQTSQFPKLGLDQLVKGVHSLCVRLRAADRGEAVFPTASCASLARWAAERPP